MLSLLKIESFAHTHKYNQEGEIVDVGPAIMHKCSAMHGDNWGTTNLLVNGQIEEVILSPILKRNVIFGDYDDLTVKIGRNFKLLGGQIDVVYKQFRWGEGRMTPINFAAFRMFITDRLAASRGYVGGDVFWTWEMNADEVVLFYLRADDDAVLQQGDWKIGKLTRMNQSELEIFMQRLGSLVTREGSGTRVRLWCPDDDSEESEREGGGKQQKKSHLTGPPPGGLSSEVKEQIDTLLGVLRIPGSKREEIGVEIPRGWILYGPPGSGKSMLAAYLSGIIPDSVLSIVRGPELLSCWIGKSEEGIRELFAPAEEEWEEKGWDSNLHIILIDEIDALLHRREGGDLTNNVVAQFLAVVDGCKKIGNIFIIGTTNRLESIDPAVKRSGRLDVCMYIGFLSSREAIREVVRVHMENEEVGEWLTDFLVRERDAIGKITGADIAKIIRKAKYAALKRLEYDVSSFMLKSEDFIP